MKLLIVDFAPIKH